MIRRWEHPDLSWIEYKEVSHVIQWRSYLATNWSIAFINDWYEIERYLKASGYIEVDLQIPRGNGMAIVTYQYTNSGQESIIRIRDTDDCAHDYRQYIGFSEVYNYCVKCDKRA